MNRRKQRRSVWKLARDGSRGDVQIELESEPDLKLGDALLLVAPATQRWNRRVTGAGTPLVDHDNVFQSFDADAPRPTPEFPSIFEWQRRHAH